MSELNVEGMALAPGVVETIVSIAVSEVEGVACVGSAGAQGRGIRAVFGQKPSTQGIEITVNEDNKLAVAVRIEVYYGFVLPEVASSLRQAVADAVASQVVVEVASVDVYIDGIQFAE